MIPDKLEELIKKRDRLQAQLRRLEIEIAKQEDLKKRSEELKCLPYAANIKAFERLKEIYDSFADGEPVESIADRFGVKPTTIKNKLGDAEWHFGQSYLASYVYDGILRTHKINAVNLERAKKIFKRTHLKGFVLISIDPVVSEQVNL